MISYHFHLKNNFDNEDDYFGHEHRCLRMMMIREYYKQNIENIQYDNINQGIQSPWQSLDLKIVNCK